MAKQEFQPGDEVKVGNDGHKMKVERYDSEKDVYFCMWFSQDKQKTIRRESFAAALLQKGNVTIMDHSPVGGANFTVSGGKVISKRF